MDGGEVEAEEVEHVAYAVKGGAVVEVAQGTGGDESQGDVDGPVGGAAGEEDPEDHGHGKDGEQEEVEGHALADAEDGAVVDGGLKAEDVIDDMEGLGGLAAGGQLGKVIGGSGRDAVGEG